MSAALYQWCSACEVLKVGVLFMSVTFYQWCSAGEVLKVSVLLCLRLSTSGVQLVKYWRSVYCYVCDFLPVMFSWWIVEGQCLCVGDQVWKGLTPTRQDFPACPPHLSTTTRCPRLPHHSDVSGMWTKLVCTFFSFFFSSFISFSVLFDHLYRNVKHSPLRHVRSCCSLI